ncbi:MAG: tetratricopeptide repeat protein [Bacteroidetes bacterium]|nr:tetratricopeptide repeat protein [Bacteroidota bacterium]HET6243462.1 tetratricopeptide repeat protein [Bacteroidia bacterium]
MKKSILKLTPAFFAFVLFFTNNTSAQTSKYGLDSANCVQNISLYREFYKQRNYKEATPYWRWVFLNCPASTEYMYADGLTIVKVMMQGEKDKAKLSALMDTLMMVYDQRIKYFGKEGYVLGRKAVDMSKMMPDKIDETYKILTKVYDLEKSKMEAAPADAYFQIALELYKNQKISKDETLEVYEKLSDILSDNLLANPTDESYNQLQENIELRFSEIADCPSLINLYGPKFKANPNDIDLLKKITKMLDKKDCAADKLYLDAVVNLDKLEPSANSKSKIAKMYLAKGSFSEAVKFYNQALELESDNNQKAQYYYELAIVNIKMGQNSSARANAQKALALRPNWGRPYMIMGDAYVSSAKDCGETEFFQSAVYWIGVDKYNQAKSIDASVTNDANARIATYSKYFPLKNDIFFNNLKEGDSYTIGCWINESTKIRARD